MAPYKCGWEDPERKDERVEDGTAYRIYRWSVFDRAALWPEKVLALVVEVLFSIFSAFHVAFMSHCILSP